MLCLFVCMILILGTTGQMPDNLKCNLPLPDVFNGKLNLVNYELVKNKLILEKDNLPARVYAYLALVKCNPGFTLIGQSYFYCEDGKLSDIPKCLTVPTCKKKLDDPNMLSCGWGFENVESNCIIPTEGIAGFGATLSPPACGRLPSGTLVVNGAPARYGDVPWHVGIYSKSTRPFMQVCGGTLVRNNVVISAAHCFWNDIEKKLPAENFAVAAGKIYRPWNNVNETSATKSDIREIRIPPRYRGGATNFQDDIAVLLLTTPLQVNNVHVVLACLDFDNILDERQLQDGYFGTVAGWGLTGADGPASQILNVVKLPIVEIDQCINSAEPSFLSSITSDKICAGYTNGTTVCRGDSGGGLAIPERDGEGDKYYLRGIVSTAPKSDHLCNVYAVATFTHLAKHEFFIRAALTDATVAAGIAIPFTDVIDDNDTTTRSSNESVNDPTDKPPVNPLNTDANSAVSPNVTGVIGNRFNNTDSSDNNTDANINLNFGENAPTNKPTEESSVNPINTDGTDVNTEATDVNNRPTNTPSNKPTRRPDNKPTDRPPNWWVNDKIKPQLNTDGKPDVTDLINDKYNNKTESLDISTAITNAPPTENNNNWDINKPTINQEKINNTKNEDPITPTLVQGTLVTEPTAAFKPVVSDLLPVNLDRNPDKPAKETSIPISSVPSESGLVHPKPGSAQGSVPNKPNFDYIPPHHHQNHPDYNDWKYWHDNHPNWQNNPQNWHNYHHNCHGNEHDYHQNWNDHQNWYYHYQNWQNYHNDWQNYHQNGPNNHQNWQNNHQNAQNNHWDKPSYDQNGFNEYQQNWHNYLVKSWQSKPNHDHNADLNQQNMPVANKNGYAGYSK